MRLKILILTMILMAGSVFAISVDDVLNFDRQHLDFYPCEGKPLPELANAQAVYYDNDYCLDKMLITAAYFDLATTKEIIPKYYLTDKYVLPKNIKLYYEDSKGYLRDFSKIPSMKTLLEKNGKFELYFAVEKGANEWIEYGAILKLDGLEYEKDPFFGSSQALKENNGNGTICINEYCNTRDNITLSISFEQYQPIDESYKSVGFRENGTPTYVFDQSLESTVIDFNGVDEFINSTEEVRCIDDFTILNMINPDVLNTDSRWLTQAGVEEGDFFFYSGNADGRLQFSRWMGGGTDYKYWTASAASLGGGLAINTWKYAAAIFYESNYTMDFYVDTTKATDEYASNYSSNIKKGNLTIGSQFNDYFDGSLDCIKIFCRALTPSEIETERQKCLSKHGLSNITTNTSLNVTYNSDGTETYNIIEWWQNNSKVSTNNGTLILDHTFGGNTLYANITSCNSTICDSIWSNSLYVMVNNDARIENHYITPSSPILYKNNYLDCSFKAEDLNNNETNASITWFKNGVNVATYDYTFVNVSLGVQQTTGIGTGRYTGAFTFGDTYICQITVDDGDSSAAYNTSFVFIDNTIATITHQNITPKYPIVSLNTLQCNFNGTDLDSDSLNASITWFKDGSRITTYDYNFTNITLGSIISTGSGTGSYIGSLVSASNYLCSITLFDGKNYTNTNTSSVTPINSSVLNMYNCSSPTDQILTVKCYDEENPTTILNYTLEVDSSYWIYDSSIYSTYNTKLEGNNTYTICLTNISLFNQIYADIYFKYTTDNGFTHRYYYVNQTFLNNSVINLSIYNFNRTSGVSDLEITVRDEATYQYYENIYGKLQKNYIEEGVWRTVQMDKSGDFGLIFYNIIEENTDYRILFYDSQMRLLTTTQTMKFSCDSGICEVVYLLNPYSETASSLDIDVSWNYDNDTQVFDVNWNNPSGSDASITLLVTQETLTGTNTICNAVQTGTSGSYSCNASGYTGVAFLSINGSQSGAQNLELSEWVDVSAQSLNALVGQSEGALISFFILLVVILMGLFSPVGVILSTIFGLIGIYFLGISNIVTTSFIVVASVMGLAIALKVRN